MDDTEYRARVLDMSSIPWALLGATISSPVSDRDAIPGAVDVILHGYPVGLPR